VTVAGGDAAAITLVLEGAEPRFEIQLLSLVQWVDPEGPGTY
jgi:hypothetical protein